MRIVSRLIIAVLALALAIPLLGGCSPAAGTARLEVVTSTSLLGSIVERVGSNLVEVVNIIPPAQCPGHFEVRPGDIQKLASARLFLMHGWQGERFSQELIASANNPGLAVFKIDVTGNWLAPPVQLEAVEEVTAVLCQADGKNCAAYQEGAAELKQIITAKEAEIKAKLGPLNPGSINVLGADQLAGFIQWVGLNLVAIYGEPETLTPQVIKGLVDKGRQAKVTLIIDNLQSGADAGKGLAEELGAGRITLSNFPGGFDNTDTWEKTIDRNIELVVKAVGR